MIEAGDIVRFSNKYLTQFKRTRWKKGFKSFRAKQQIAKVLNVSPSYERWFHGRKTMHFGVATLDIPDVQHEKLFGRKVNLGVCISYLRLVRKARRPSLQDRSCIAGACRD